VKTAINPHPDERTVQALVANSLDVARSPARIRQRLV
jgi:hypothetical protein